MGSHEVYRGMELLVVPRISDGVRNSILIVFELNSDIVYLHER